MQAESPVSDEDPARERRLAEMRLFRQLRGRARLHDLADTAPAYKSDEELALDRMRVYLRDWRARQGDGYTSGGSEESFLAEFAKSSREAMELLAESDGWAMAVIDASVDDIAGIEDPEAGLMRAALRVRWLNEGLSKTGEIKIRVFRSGRLQGLSLEECDRLADRAERELLPIVRRRGLPV